MTDITDRLERLYTDHGTNHVQEAARTIRNLRAEVGQLRQYLDTAQRRASALGDEVAKLREAQIDYTVLHGFADKHRISYNELCVAVRAALAARKGTT